MLESSLRRAAAALALGLTLAGCSTPEPLANTGDSISALVSNVTVRDGAVAGALVTGAVPTGSAGPTASVSGISAAVNGGSAAVSVTGSDSYSRLLISAAGATDYYSVPLPSSSTLENVVVSIAPGVGASQLTLQYALEGANGIGPIASQAMRLIHVGTGDFQASVAWTGASDVDLHVFDPNGEHVYYGAPTATTGGTLDLDSNPACSIDNKNNENIVWPLNRAPAGPYRVEVHYFSDCGVARSDWVATVLIKGQAPQTFTGSFVGPTASNPPAVLGTFTY